ncbi:MAG: VIT domain-containing protein [Cyanobacteria bacterium P01_C01_bin.89]
MAQNSQASQSGDRVTSSLRPLLPSDAPDMPTVDPRATFVLKNTDVNAQVSGNLARVEVTQTFKNPFDVPLDAVYTFPLPDESAVDDLEITLGDRTIKGLIKKREEAQEIFEQARQEGRTASLLEQERANIFTQSLTNIRPGETIKVTLRYTESLKFGGGDYEFVFPMVVGPRYIPGRPIDGEGNTAEVPDADRINAPVLTPGMRSGHDIQVKVVVENWDGIGPVKQVRSPSHDLDIQSQRGATVIELDKNDTIPNKDLILRYQVSGKDTQATVFTHGDDRGGHFGMYLVPAVDYKQRAIVPRDIVFLMDTSGSQRGAPIAQSKALMRRLLHNLHPDDTFTILDFANTTTRLSAAPLKNNRANRQKAFEYVDALDANGGTNLQAGIDAVMNFPAQEEGRLRTIVLLTDGYIGNDREIIGEVRDRLQPGNRLFSFGVGSSTNRFLLDRLAEVGRGASQVVRQDEKLDDAVERFFKQLSNPVLTNVQVRWEGSGAAPEIYPGAAPDLFAAQPLVIFGRKKDLQPGTLVVTGTQAGGRRYEERFNLTFDQRGQEAIAQLWARSRIKSLMNQLYGNEVKSLVDQVTNTALAYRLLSQYTAFVAVSQEVRVEPDGTRRSVEVPVELPEGVSYEGIFGGAVNGAPPRPAPPGSAPVSRRASGTRGQSQVGAIGRPAPLIQPQALPPGDMAESGEIAPQEPSCSPVNPKIAVIKAEGLTDEQLEKLKEYLCSVAGFSGVSGDVFLEVNARNGRLVRIVVDDTQSTIRDRNVLNRLRQTLQAWQVSGTSPTKIQLQLRL